MKRFDQINVIPFIDIMLVLLAIVLTTASFIVQDRLDIELPAAQSRASPTDAALEIAIDRDQNLYLDGRPVDLAALRGRLGAVDPGAHVTLRVDREARFARFVQVVDLLKAARLSRVAILTREAS